MGNVFGAMHMALDARYSPLATKLLALVPNHIILESDSLRAV